MFAVLKILLPLLLLALCQMNLSSWKYITKFIPATCKSSIIFQWNRISCFGLQLYLIHDTAAILEILLPLLLTWDLPQMNCYYHYDCQSKCWRLTK